MTFCRHTGFLVLLAAVAGAVVLPAGGAWASPGAPMDEAAANETLQSIFGQELKRVASTADRKDDVGLAAHLLDGARGSVREPALLAALCEKVIELGLQDASGLPVAAEAAQLLAGRVPGKRLSGLTSLVNVRQRQYTAATPESKNKAAGELLEALLALAAAQTEAGDCAAAAGTYRRAQSVPGPVTYMEKDNIQALLDAALQRERVAREVGALKARLAAMDVDAAARKRIIDLYVVELDDPAEAAKYLDPLVDDATRTYVRLAAGSVADVAAPASMELAQWYFAHAAAASAAAKPAMLRRVKAYCENYLAKHTGQDLTRTKAQLSLKAAEAELARLAEGPGGAWVDLMQVLDPAKDVTGDRVQIQAGRLGIPRDATVWFPVVLEGSYEAEIRFEVRDERWRSLSLELPVGPGRTRLSLNSTAGKRGKDSLGPLGEGRKRSKYDYIVLGQEPGTSPANIQVGRVHALHLAMTWNRADDDIQLTVKLDGTTLATWKGKSEDIVIVTQQGSKRGQGLLWSSHYCPTVIHGAKARMVSGRMKPAR